MWAYENIGTDSGAKDAPSAGAWGLLQWAKRAPDKFYPEIIRLLGKKADLDLTSEGSREWTEEKVEHIDAFLQAIQDGRDDYSEGAGDEPAMEA